MSFKSQHVISSNSNLGFALHRLATIHPWHTTDGQKNGRQSC